MTLPQGNYALSWEGRESRHVVPAWQPTVGNGLRLADGTLGYLEWYLRFAAERRAKGQPVAVYLNAPHGPLLAGYPWERLTADYSEFLDRAIAAGLPPDLWMADAEFFPDQLDGLLVHAAVLAPALRKLPNAAICFWVAAPRSAAAAAVMRSPWSGGVEQPLPITDGTINDPCDYLCSGQAKSHRSPMGRLAQACNGINGCRQADPIKRICGWAGSHTVADAGVSVNELEAWYTHLLVRTGGPVLLFDQDDSAGAGQRCRDAFDRVADRLNAALADRKWKRQLRTDVLHGPADKTISSVAELDDGSVLAAYTTSYTRTKPEPISSGLGWVIDMPVPVDGSKTAICVGRAK